MSKTVYPKRSWLQTRLMRAIRDHEPQEEIDAIRKAYYEAKLVEHIEAQIAAAPPLSKEQKARISALLRAS